MSGSHHRDHHHPTHSSYHHHSSTSHQHSHHPHHQHQHSQSPHHRQPSHSHAHHAHHSHHQGHISPASSSSTAGAASPLALGTPGPISPEDLAFLRQQQRNLGISPAGSTSTGNVGGRRGGGGGNSSGGLSLDPNALAALSNHFDNLLLAIASRVQTLSEQTLASTQSSHRQASQVADRATVEIENLRDILRQCDELETEFLKIRRLGEMVKGFRARIEGLERRVGR